MKKTLIVFLCLLSTIMTACNNDPDNEGNGGDNGGRITAPTTAEQNILRAMQIVDKAAASHFTGSEMAMARYYNPYTDSRSDEKGSVWMYTSSIEAVNAILHGLEALKDHGSPELYNEHYTRYTQLLSDLYENAAYYKGTFTLTSYTQTKEWSIYGVDRGNGKGAAKVDGILNVYDDQQWLIRELIEAYKLTGNNTYLTEAEYLTEYVLDGWDCTLDANGNENGGITWGPGYTSKHSCSNGPMISPLVWLHELYKGKNDEITRHYIATDNKRETEIMKKSDYYLKYAKAIYDWQKSNLLNANGLFYDFLGGGDSSIKYETVDGVQYRAHTARPDKIGPYYSYNTGSMISGAADLYRVTNNTTYLDDSKKYSDASFSYFAKLDATVAGYYTYDISGFANWFNGVLLRGYIDTYNSYKNVDVNIESFQNNLDYAYNNFLYKDLLPPSLLAGWNRDKGKNNVEAMFTFAFAAEYAVLAKYELEKK